MRFAVLKWVCFILLLNVCQSNPKRYWSVLYLVIEWAWVCFKNISGDIMECGFCWNSLSSTDILSFFHQNFKLNCLRQKRFSSFVGKFTRGKTRFFWIFRKVTNTSKWKLKLDINHLKKYLIWNFHLIWPAQFREWSANRKCAYTFYSKIFSHFRYLMKNTKNTSKMTENVVTSSGWIFATRHQKIILDTAFESPGRILFKKIILTNT